MYYQKFKIKNFQGIEDVEIDLTNNRILTLVGLNESGKTTILESIDWFYKFIKNEEPKPEDLNVFRPKGIDFTGEIVIEGFLKLEVTDVSKIKEFWKTLDADKELEIGSEFSFAFITEFKLHKFEKNRRTVNLAMRTKDSEVELHKEDLAKWQKVVEFIKKELIPEILFYEDFTFDIPEKIEFSIGPETPKTLESKNKIWQMVLDDILRAVNPDFNFKEHVVSIWLTDSNTAENRVAKIEGQLNEKITKAWKELFHKESKKLNFKEIKLKCDIQANILSVSFQVKTDSDKVFSINERSKGCKWFFSFLLFTEFRKNRTKNILFLLDEPASNLHSSAQIKILDAIGDLSNKAMVIYSTHSHHLVKVEWLSGAYVVVNDLLSKEQLEGDIEFLEGSKVRAMKYFRYVGLGLGSDKVSYFQPILDALDYKPSPVEPIPKIVILEGRNDWYTIRYFTEVMLNVKKGPNFYPGAGVDKLWDIIRIYLSWGTGFVVLVDDDSAGKAAVQKYKDEFGKILDDKVFTLAAAGLKNEMEDQIEPMDQKAIYDGVFGTGSYDLMKRNGSNLKKNLNSALSQLLIEKRKINISEETLGRFKCPSHDLSLQVVTL